MEFKPHLIALVENDRPSQITLYAITGGSRRYTYALPEDITAWSPSEEQTCLCDKANQIMTSTNGMTMFQGEILGFAYFKEQDQSPFLLNTLGYPDQSLKNCNIPGPAAACLL